MKNDSSVRQEDQRTSTNNDFSEIYQALEQSRTSKDEKPSIKDKREANAAANTSNVRNAAEVAAASGHPVAMGIGNAIKKADMYSNGKSSELIGKRLEKDLRKLPLGRRLQKKLNKLNDSGASDAIGKAASMKNGKVKDATSDLTRKGNNEKNAQSSGSGSLELKMQNRGIWKWILLCSGCLMALVFLAVFISSVFELRVESVILGNMSASDRDLVEDVINNIESGLGSDLGTGNSNIDKYLKRMKSLGNNFSASFECEGEECLERAEVKYYLKVADIALRYKNKYNVNLDWVLLNATMMYSDLGEEATMERSLHEYNLDDVENYDILMDLDWDYDYKEISGYKYLDSDDYRYDLQILAKNMVTKTTTQQCTKSTKDSEGNVNIKVTKEQVDTDVEDKYFKSGASHYLKCDSGEKYSIFSIYKLDLEKYDEFLLEYLENKFYLSSDKYQGNYTQFTCISKEFTKYDLTDDQLAQLASVAYHEQGTAKGAAAEASLMANLFEERGSSYGEGADGLYNYVRNSGWFAHAASHMDDYAASEEIIAAVKSVLVDGKRTIPGYINEHDWINDLESVTTNGETVDRTDREAYVPFETVIKNKYGSTYTFYSFPDTNSDPFGYTSESRREEIGDFHYDYDTGEPVSCSVGGTDLSSAFVNLALSKQGISGTPNEFTKWYGPLGLNADGTYDYPDNGLSYPWCATFVSWVVSHTEFEGQKLSDIIKKNSASAGRYAEYFANDSNLQYVEGEYYGGKYVPKQGDIIFFAWRDEYGNCTYNGPLSSDHVGIVVEVKEDFVYTIEGNTSNSVDMREHPLNDCETVGYGVWY